MTMNKRFFPHAGPERRRVRIDAQVRRNDKLRAAGDTTRNSMVWRQILPCIIGISAARRSPAEEVPPACHRRATYLALRQRMLAHLAALRPGMFDHCFYCMNDRLDFTTIPSLFDETEEQGGSGEPDEKTFTSPVFEDKGNGTVLPTAGSFENEGADDKNSSADVEAGGGGGDVNEAVEEKLVAGAAAAKKKKKKKKKRKKKKMSPKEAAEYKKAQKKIADRREKRDAKKAKLGKG